MLEYTLFVTLANDDGHFANTAVRFVDKGRGRVPMWRCSCQLQDIALNPGGVYQMILPDGRSIDFTVDACEALGADKSLVTFTISEDLNA